MTMTKALACVCIYARSCAACVTVCLTSQDSMLDCILVKEHVLGDVNLRKKENELVLTVCLCAQYLYNFAETETFCVLDYSLPRLHAESECGQE